MKIFKQTALAAAAIVALGVGSTGVAQASAKAFSTLDIDNFVIRDSGGTQYTAASFDVLTALNTGTSQGDLDSIAGNVAFSDGPTPGGVDPLQACQGSGCPGQNSFGQTGTFVGPFARGDALLTGSIIVAGGAHSQQVAELQVPAATSDGGLGNSAVTNASSFSFSLASADDSITFEFDASGELHLAFGDDVISGTLFASHDLEIVIRDPGLAVVYRFSTDPLNAANIAMINDSFTVSAPPSPFDAAIPFGPTFVSSTTPILSAALTYTLTITSHTDISGTVIEVPEIDAIAGTGALTFLGGALALMGERRRRRVQA